MIKVHSLFKGVLGSLGEGRAGAHAAWMQRGVSDVDRGCGAGPRAL